MHYPSAETHRCGDPRPLKGASSGARILKDEFLIAGHHHNLHRPSPSPSMRRTLRKYMNPATTESTKPA